MTIKFLKLVLLVFLLSNCQSSHEAQAPWIGLTYLNKIGTNVIVKNTQEVTQSIEMHYFNKTTRETIDKKVNLSSGQVDTISIDLFRPEFISIKHPSGYNTIYLLPEMDLELSLNDTISVVGSNEANYSTLLEVGENKMDMTTLENLMNKSELPQWLKDYLYKSNELEKLYKVHQELSYQQFIGNREVSISMQDSLNTDMLLRNEEGARFHNYYSLLQRFRSFCDTRAKDPDFPIKKESYKLSKDLARMVSAIQRDKLRIESLAMHVEGLIRRRKSFDGKDEVYSGMIRNLPEEYVLKLNEIDKEYSVQSYELEAVIELLQKEIISTEGIKIPLTENKKDFKLLKFWFAGCAPCKKQIPYENELLDQFENLDILHFCKYTDQDKWQEYIVKNDSKGSHYYVSEEKLERFKKTFALTYSPRYVLLDKDDKVLCWECASPNDLEIKKFLSQH